ncbi:MAG TPA: Mur ligase family protein [Candidatus Binatia bacterium]
MARGYQEILAALYALEARKGMDFRLERLTPVLDALGHPERTFACVHLAGTNGKGSTAAMIEAALRAGGYRTGLYTSPHLVSFRERIRICGAPVSREAVVDGVQVVSNAASQCSAGLTFFEIATLAAFVEFRSRKVDIAIVEAGLGGRLDATNVVHGDVAVITSVGIDHAEYLGNSIAAIAAEKAAIIKPGSIAISGAVTQEALEAISRRATEVGARHLAWGRDFGPFAPLVEARREQGRGLAGDHQVVNAAVAAAAVDALAPRFALEAQIRNRAIIDVRWPARLEAVPRRSGSGLLILDAAHNPEAARALAAAVETVAPAHPRVLVFAAMADKDWRAMLEALAPHFDRIVATAPPMPRAERPQRFLEVAPDAIVEESPSRALEVAEELASVHGSIVVTGSIFLLGTLYRAAGGTLLEQDLED